MSSSYGLTKDQILGSVRGYADSDRAEASDESLNVVSSAIKMLCGNWAYRWKCPFLPQKM
jgi:hypothetical protein